VNTRRTHRCWGARGAGSSPLTNVISGQRIRIYLVSAYNAMALLQNNVTRSLSPSFLETFLTTLSVSDCDRMKSIDIVSLCCASEFRPLPKESAKILLDRDGTHLDRSAPA
jgi:hypothetical protein